MAASLVLLLGYTVATTLWVPLRVGVLSPDLRIVLEVLRLCCSLFAAVALALPGNEGADPARPALVAALAALGVSNAVFGITPILLPIEGPQALGLLFYPWLTARYIGGVLFLWVLWAGRRQIPLSLSSALALVVGVLAAVDLLYVVTRWGLPLPVNMVAGHMVVRAATAAENLAIVVIPGALFGAGALLAWKVFLRTTARVYAWVALALVIQMFAHIHQLYYPTILGPTITTADALRLLAVVALLAAGLAELRRIEDARSAAVRSQAADLLAQQRMLEELRALLDREEDFRSLAVHEMGAPLAAMRAFAHVLRQHTDGDEQAMAAVEGITAEARQLHELVDRMDELRTLELDGFRCELRPVQLCPLLEEAGRFVEGLPGAHTAAVNAADMWVSADPVRLGQVIRNLLANAARYSPDGSPIVIDGYPARPGWAEIVVSDHGPGIPAEECDRVLGKYARGAWARRTQPGGQGLGLYIARRIMEAHGGRLTLASVGESGGARAVIELREAP